MRAPTKNSRSLRSRAGHWFAAAYSRLVGGNDSLCGTQLLFLGPRELKNSTKTLKANAWNASLKTKQKTTWHWAGELWLSKYRHLPGSPMTSVWATRNRHTKQCSKRLKAWQIRKLWTTHHYILLRLRANWVLYVYLSLCCSGWQRPSFWKQNLILLLKAQVEESLLAMF